MKSYPLSLIDENDDNSSQTHISSTKPKKYIKEDDISTENTLNNQKKYNFQEKYINNKKPNVNSQQRIVFDFRNKLVKENFNIMNNNKSEISSKGGLIDDTNEETNIYETAVKEVFNILDQINLAVMSCYQDLFEYKYFIKCRVDQENEVNVFLSKIGSFIKVFMHQLFLIISLEQ